MKSCAMCKAVKPLAEFYAERRGKFGVRAVCKHCMNAVGREYSRVYRKENPAKVKATNRAQYLKTIPENRARHAAWVRANPERKRELMRSHYARHPHVFKAAAKARMAAKLRATPAWANQFFIEEAYALAGLRSAQQTGGIAKWHVDHIIPLRSKLVCGLHVENNLEVIPAGDNIRKSNRYWPDMP